jgi:hypothetical protein
VAIVIEQKRATLNMDSEDMNKKREDMNKKREDIKVKRAKIECMINRLSHVPGIPNSCFTPGHIDVDRCAYLTHHAS